MNFAIIVAAGTGSRFGGDAPKQFLEIHGKSVIAHTLERFEACPQIDEIILVLSPAQIENFQKISEKYNFKKLVKIISGGKTRAESVLSGLGAIDSQTCQIVAVHDGARPLVSVEEITSVIEKAQHSGAACLVAAVTDTIKEISGDKIVQTIERAKLRRALTPQAFRFEILKSAFETHNFNRATDESFLVENLGIEVSIVEGSARNIKITHAEDLVLAESLLGSVQ